MKICIPSGQNNDVKSFAYGHFGNAPFYIIFDTERKEYETVDNNHSNHGHGQCNPIKALDDRKVDAVVVGGMGPRALSILSEYGIKVFRADINCRVEEIINDWGKINLRELTMNDACSHHH